MSVSFTAPRRAYLGLGSNLDEPAAHIEAAVRAIDTLLGVRVVACSSLYRSAPVGFVDQPDFINAVVAVDTEREAEALLSALLGLEREHGRVRDRKNGPRTLDVDILLFGDEVINLPSLEIPHPRLHERAFVLLPLIEIAPEVVIPGRGAAREWLAATQNQACERIEQ